MPKTITLLSIRMILAKAMRDVRSVTPDDSEPFEISAAFQFSSQALVMPIDPFNDEFIQPAIDVAMADKRPLSGEGEFPRTTQGVDMEEVITYCGIFGRIQRKYDIHDDAFPVRLDIRVPAATTPVG